MSIHPYNVEPHLEQYLRFSKADAPQALQVLEVLLFTFIFMSSSRSNLLKNSSSSVESLLREVPQFSQYLSFIDENPHTAQ
jgi:hypothetical protein